MRSFNLAEAIPLLPDELADLLVRGAYLECSLRMLELSREEQAARLATVRASQPPFLFLRPKETRAAFKVAKQDTSTELSTLDQAVDVNKKLTGHLRARCEVLLEQWLRDQCEEYRTGLVSAGFAEDWNRSLAHFTDHANEFIRALGWARNMATAGYDHVKNKFSQAAYQAISDAHVVAVKVEAEIAAMNGIADAHDNLVRRTVFDDPMPRLTHESYAATVAEIACLPVAAAQVEFNRVIAAVEELLTRELVVVRDRVGAVAANHRARVQSYVRDAWNQLHVHALTHSVESEQVGPVVEQTERLYRADCLSKV
ncbi:MAG TPA: hypothetical protein VIM44_04855 [Rariglobus sp.]